MRPWGCFLNEITFWISRLSRLLSPVWVAFIQSIEVLNQNKKTKTEIIWLDCWSWDIGLLPSIETYIIRFGFQAFILGLEITPWALLVLRPSDSDCKLHHWLSYMSSLFASNFGISQPPNSLCEPIFIISLSTYGCVCVFSYISYRCCCIRESWPI